MFNSKVATFENVKTVAVQEKDIHVKTAKALYEVAGVYATAQKIVVSKQVDLVKNDWADVKGFFAGRKAKKEAEKAVKAAQYDKDMKSTPVTGEVLV